MVCHKVIEQMGQDEKEFFTSSWWGSFRFMRNLSPSMLSQRSDAYRHASQNSRIKPRLSPGEPSALSGVDAAKTSQPQLLQP